MASVYSTYSVRIYAYDGDRYTVRIIRERLVPGSPWRNRTSQILSETFTSQAGLARAVGQAVAIAAESESRARARVREPRK